MINTVKEKWAMYSGYMEFLPLVLIGILLSTEDEFDDKLLATGIKMLFIFVFVVIAYICCSVMKFNRKIILVVITILWIFLIYAKRCIIPPVAIKVL